MRFDKREADLRVQVVETKELPLGIHVLELRVDGQTVFLERHADSESWGRLARQLVRYSKEKLAPCP